MSDLISRQAAIDAINQICPIDTEYDCTLLDRVDVRCVLTDLPSARPEQPEQWIPCSERLPERNGYYLVTGRRGAVNKLLYQDGYWYGNWKVFAWMPLPEPYREERTEE